MTRLRAISGESLVRMSVSQIVREDFRHSNVFDTFGINYCCRGDRSLESACEDAQVELGEVISSLLSDGRDEANSCPSGGANKSGNAAAESVAYLMAESPVVKEVLVKVADSHGEDHAELASLVRTFDTLKELLDAHLSRSEISKPPHLFVSEWIQNSRSHVYEELLSQVDAIRSLSRGYRIPSDACETYRVALLRLRAFDVELRRYLEMRDGGTKTLRW